MALLQNIQAEVAQEREELRITDAWYRFCRKHREVGPSDANKARFREAVGNDALFTVEGLELLLGDPAFVRTLHASKTETELKGELIDSIIGLLHKAMSPDQLVAERKRLRFFTVEGLERRLDDVKRTKAIEALPVSQIREIGKPAQSGPEPLPADITVQAIKKAGKDTLKFWIRRYGRDAINARLQGE